MNLIVIILKITYIISFFFDKTYIISFKFYIDNILKIKKKMNIIYITHSREIFWLEVSSSTEVFLLEMGIQFHRWIILNLSKTKESSWKKKILTLNGRWHVCSMDDDVFHFSFPSIMSLLFLQNKQKNKKKFVVVKWQIDRN